jgi:hypothetical protein
MSPRRDRTLTYLTVVLCLAAVAFVAKGTYHLVLDDRPSAAFDLRLRWQEQHYVFRHKNPYEVRAQADARKPSAGSRLADEAGIESDFGIPDPGYPPWAYATGAVLFWPSNWTVARCFFAAVNLLLLIPIGLWARRVGQPHGKAVASFFCAAVLAAGAICHTLGDGQYGIIVLASLVGAFWLDERHRPMLSGLLIGVALVKPTLSLPFLVPMLVKRRYLALATAAVYIGLGSCLTWWLTSTDPITMLNQMVATNWLGAGADPIAFLFRAGVDIGTAAKAVAAVVITVLFALAFLYRQASMLTLFGISACAARFWTYHRQYDNLILVFSLLALGTLGLEKECRKAIAAFIGMGLTLWLPARATDELAIQLLMMLVWIACLAVLLAVAREERGLESGMSKLV